MAIGKERNSYLSFTPKHVFKRKKETFEWVKVQVLDTDYSKVYRYVKQINS